MSPLVELPGFEEAVQRQSWSGSREVVLFEGRRHCRFCSVGEVVRVGRSVQPALFYHGGYGEAVARTVDLCLACGRVFVVRTESLNPRHL